MFCNTSPSTSSMIVLSPKRSSKRHCHGHTLVSQSMHTQLCRYSDAHLNVCMDIKLNGLCLPRRTSQHQGWFMCSEWCYARCGRRCYACSRRHYHGHVLVSLIMYTVLNERPPQCRLGYLIKHAMFSWMSIRISKVIGVPYHPATIVVANNDDECPTGCTYINKDMCNNGWSLYCC